MGKRLLHTPEGVRDIYGREYAVKLQVEKNIRESIRLYGYEDIQTPVFEFFDVFSREVGTTPSKDLYKFFDKEHAGPASGFYALHRPLRSKVFRG